MAERVRLLSSNDCRRSQEGSPQMVALEWVASILALVLAPIFLVRCCKRRVAAFHRAVTNRVAIRFAARLPGFGIISNVGRKSGRLYRTPVNVFREPDGFLIALTYGRDSGWVRNVLAAEGCQLETRRIKHSLFRPVVVHDPSRKRFPLLVRFILGLVDANDFLQLSASPHGGSPPQLT
jgi:deazaflavin-dependent oxidoreductase (nitroreductase family)